MPHDHVQQLRDLVDFRGAQNSADARRRRRRHHVGRLVLDARMHGSDFVEREGLLATPEPRLAEERSTRCLETYGDHRQNDNRSQQQQPGRTRGDVDDTLHSPEPGSRLSIRR